jgi:hypothetical protein
LDKIHLVYKAEDFGGRTAFVESSDDVRVGDYVSLELARLDVEDEDEYGDGAEDMAA